MAAKQMTSLEERLKQLEELTSKLEEGNLSIDEAISVYSQGMDLAVSCKKSLDSLSQKITVARKKAQQSLSDDALLNCFVPVEAKKEESLISKLENRPTIDTIDNVTIKLDGENLLNKYNSGEQLDVIEYKILKEYLMSKQGN